MSRKTLEGEIKVGIFLAVGVVLFMLTVILLGGANPLVKSFEKYYVRIDDAQGLVQGSKVILNGIRVGVVGDVEFSEEWGQIKVTLLVENRFSRWLYQDAELEVATLGVLGDKYIAVRGGEKKTTQLPVESIIPVSESPDLKSVLSNSGELVETLNSIAVSLDVLLKSIRKNNRHDKIFKGLADTSKDLSLMTANLNRKIDKLAVEETVDRVNSILRKIDNGKGSMGALVNDPSLYDDMKALVGAANRNRVVRNLVRKSIKDSEEASQKPKSKEN